MDTIKRYCKAINLSITTTIHQQMRLHYLLAYILITIVQTKGKKIIIRCTAATCTVNTHTHTHTHIYIYRHIYTRFQMNTNIYTFFLYSSAADRTNYRYNFSKVKYNSCCLNNEKSIVFWMWNIHASCIMAFFFRPLLNFYCKHYEYINYRK